MSWGIQEGLKHTRFSKIPCLLNLDGDDTVDHGECAQNSNDHVELAQIKSRHLDSQGLGSGNKSRIGTLMAVLCSGIDMDFVFAFKGGLGEGYQDVDTQQGSTVEQAKRKGSNALRIRKTK